MKLEVVVQNLAQTEALAYALAKRLRGGETIELVGDVGSGKTTFTRFLLAGLGSVDHVSSPTFTVSNVYTAGRLPVYHFDFYRLGNDDELIRHELAEQASDPDGVTILEWAESVQAVMPEEYLKIRISPTSEDERVFHIEIPKSYEYMGGA